MEKIVGEGRKMAETNAYRNHKDRYSRFGEESDFILACTLSGRVVHASAELKLRLGTELSGRNLNDFLDDRTVAEIIAKSAVGEYCRFSCLLGGRMYSALSEKEGGVITISFYEDDEHSADGAEENSLKYLQGEINTLLSNLLGSFKNMGAEESPAMMFAKKNIYRLLRASRNVFDHAACRNGTMQCEKREHDVLEIVTAVVESLRFPLRAVNTEIDIWHDGEKHVCTCVSQHVERMLSNVITCALKGSLGGSDRMLTVEVMSKDNDVLISVLSQKRILNERMLTNTFNESHEQSHRADDELVQSLLTVKSLAAYNGGSFIVTAEKDGDRMVILLPKADDDRSFRFKSPGVRYMSGTNTALVELAEILPDSLY